MIPLALRLKSLLRLMLFRLLQTGFEKHARLQQARDSPESRKLRPRTLCCRRCLLALCRSRRSMCTMSLQVVSTISARIMGSFKAEKLRWRGHWMPQHADTDLHHGPPASLFLVFQARIPCPPGREAWVRSLPTPTHKTCLRSAVGDLK
jgi:hypothetical protein